MKRLLLLAFAVLVNLQTSAIADEKAVEIPLDEIWAFDMPGTRDIAGIPLPKVDESKQPGTDYETYRSQRASYIEQMRRHLTAKPSSEPALPGFIIPRPIDFHTLRRADMYLAINKKLGFNRPLGRLPDSSYPVSDASTTLVFFSYPAAYHVRLTKVERQGQVITVRYKFQPHSSIESTVHFALIPLGTLPVGEYRVKFEQERMEQKYYDAGFVPVVREQNLISRPFSFTVFEPPAPESANVDKNAVQIPLDVIWAYQMPGTRNVRDLQTIPKKVTKEEFLRQSLVEVINMPLRKGRPTKATPGFAVQGVGLDALRQVRDVMAGDSKSSDTLPAESEVSLFFYSYLFGAYVHIDSVERKGNTFTIKWRFVTHATLNATTHFALIPVGKLPSGTYECKLEQLGPTAQDALVSAQAFAPVQIERVVCDPFSFTVQ